MKPATINIPPGVERDDDATTFRTRAAIARTIAVCHQIGEEWRVPLFQAAYDGLISLMVLPPGAVVSDRLLSLPRPTLIIIADDQPTATGPAAWPQAKRLLRWAGGCILHAAGGTAEHSALAVRMTLQERRGLVVEMEMQHYALWAKLVEAERRRGLHALSILPTQGVHPLPGAPAGTVLQ